MENPVEIFSYFFVGTVGLFLVFIFMGSRNRNED